jgi:hypothetical protein
VRRVRTETPSDCAARQSDHFVDRLVQIETTLSRRRFLDVITDAVDDLSGSIGSAYHTAELFLDLTQVGRLPIQEIQSSTRVVARGSDRLRDFVRQRDGQFSHHAHAVHVGEVCLKLT